MSRVQDLFDKKLGLGMMRLPILEGETVDEAQVCKMVDTYLERGFKYFDTAYVYHSQQSESVVKRCIVDRYDRDKFYLATKMPIFLVREARDYEDFFNRQLERCGVEYFDLYLLHSMNEKTFRSTEELGGFEYVQKMKEQGKARHIGFSFHDTPEVLDEILTKHPEMEFVQLQINYFDWENPKVQSRACYEVACKHNKPIIIMEPIKGGSLINLPQEAKEYIAKEYGDTPASLAIRFAASPKEVMMVLSGMSDMAQLEENTTYMQNFVPLSDTERAITDKVNEIIRAVPTIQCTACKYCVDDCPQKINIPGIFAVYNNDQQFYKGEPDKKAYEMRTKDGGKASDCIKCGLCEGHCPQHIQIREELVKMAEIFE